MPSLSGFRLIHGVTLAAICLLALKAISFLGGSAEMAEDTRRNPKAEFGKVLTFARADPELADPITTGSVEAKAKPKAEEPAAVEAPSASAPIPPLVPPSAAEKSLLERLGQRREELQQRGREIEAQEKVLQEQERRLDDRLGQVKAAEDAQKGASSAKAASPGRDLKSLVSMYESMKPKEAARVFDRLPLDILVSVVTEMNPRKMSEILAAMAPEGAEKLTVMLARRARGGDERIAAAGAPLPAGELQAIEPAPTRKAPGLMGR